MATRLLIVDDNEVLGEIVARLLEALGHEVETETDARRVQTRLQERHFDLVLTDLMMPHISGIELVRQIRAEHAIPVIILTAHGSTRTAREALVAGAADFITKPIDGPFLDQRVRKAIASETA